MSTYSLFGTFARIVRKVLKVILLVAIVGYTITPFALIYAPHSIDFFVFLNHGKIFQNIPGLINFRLLQLPCLSLEIFLI